MKKLLVIIAVASIFTSCKTVALQQQYVYKDGKEVRVGKPQPYKQKEGDTFYVRYKRTILK